MLISMTSLLTTFDNCIELYDASLYSECTQKVRREKVRNRPILSPSEVLAMCVFKALCAWRSRQYHD